MIDSKSHSNTNAIAQTTKDLLNRPINTKHFIAIRTKATEHTIAKQTSHPNYKQMPTQLTKCLRIALQIPQNISTQNQCLQKHTKHAFKSHKHWLHYTRLQCIIVTNSSSLDLPKVSSHDHKVKKLTSLRS